MKDARDDIAVSVLRVLQEMEDNGGSRAWGADIEAITERLSIDVSQIGQQLDALADAGYISVKGNTESFGDPNGHYGIKLLPEGRAASGPEATSAESDDPAKQSRLKSFAQQFREDAPDTAANFLLESLGNL